MEYRDAQLTPATTYVYRVIVHNGVSYQDSINVHLRTREVMITALDGCKFICSMKINLCALCVDRMTACCCKIL